MEPFDVYRLYMSLKLHFTSDQYDITKTKSAVKCKPETFMKRKDILLFRKLAKKYEKKELINFFVSNFVNGHNGVFDSESVEVYENWKTLQGRLSYQFKQDAGTIMEWAEATGQDPLVSYDGQHPIVLKLFLGKKITLESVIVLDKLFDFVYSNDTSMQNDFIWKDFARLVKKYRIFIKFDKDKFFSIWTKENDQKV